MVAALCLGLLLLTLGAAGETGRRRAKEAVCQTNLHHWGRYFQDYLEQNDGKFFTGCTPGGYWWPLQLPQEMQDWKSNRTWFCPTATSPRVPNIGAIPATLSIYNAWGVESPATTHAPALLRHEGRTYTMHPNGINGSLGLNGYMLNIPGGAYLSGVRATNGWRNLGNIEHADAVPVFQDALRFDGWPTHTDPPPEVEHSVWLIYPQMRRYCIDRHDGAVNCLFVDGSVRKVGLKELWTLKWHREFNTAGPWTRAGGVLPSDWPQWMSLFKEY